MGLFSWMFFFRRNRSNTRTNSRIDTGGVEQPTRGFSLARLFQKNKISGFKVIKYEEDENSYADEKVVSIPADMTFLGPPATGSFATVNPEQPPPVPPRKQKPKRRGVLSTIATSFTRSPPKPPASSQISSNSNSTVAAKSYTSFARKGSVKDKISKFDRGSVDSAPAAGAPQQSSTMRRIRNRIKNNKAAARSNTQLESLPTPGKPSNPIRTTGNPGIMAQWPPVPIPPSQNVPINSKRNTSGSSSFASDTSTDKKLVGGGYLKKSHTTNTENGTKNQVSPRPTFTPVRSTHPVPSVGNGSSFTGFKPSEPEFKPNFKYTTFGDKKENLRESIRGLKDLASFWDKVGETNKKKQEINPFSENFNGKREIASGNILESKSDERAVQAKQWTEREIERVVQVVKDYGEYDSSRNATMITFGELFKIYENISDTLVFMLIKARKRNLLQFDSGEMLLQGRDDHVQIYAFN